MAAVTKRVRDWRDDRFYEVVVYRGTFDGRRVLCGFDKYKRLLEVIVYNGRHDFVHHSSPFGYMTKTNKFYSIQMKQGRLVLEDFPYSNSNIAIWKENKWHSTDSISENN